MIVQVEVTTHCNFECFYCAGRDMPQRHMAWETFERILDAVPAGRHMVSLQGEGEPTTHPQFWEMAEAVRARGHAPFTITNGLHMDIERLAAAFPRIGVSLDTLDGAEAERIGRHKLARVLENLDALAARVGGRRIHLMSVNYGQPLDAVRNYARARGFSHSVQVLQAKPDYARRYPDLLETPPPRYTYRCRYLARPLKRYYDIEGREYPCCFIKDARLHEPVEAMQAKMAAGELPAGCSGCREVLAADSLPRPRAAASVSAPIDTAAVADSGPAPALSIVTTCKGRLAHLQQTLPSMAAQAGAEVIVVDYDCPERSGAWVEANVPQARVVRVAGAPFFKIAHARNLGAAQARGEWLAFVDADMLLEPDFAARAMPLLGEGAYYRLDSAQAAAFGTVLVRRADFEAVGGYDEVIEGYGTEDRDLYLRLEAAGRRRELLPGAWGRSLEHAREDSVRHYEIKDPALNQRINATYVQIKQDLARQFGAGFLAPEARRGIYAEVRRAFREAAASGQPATRINVTLPPALDVRLYGWQMARVWTYYVNPAPPPGMGAPRG